MSFRETMARLKRLGNADWRKIMPNHGIRPPVFGVRYADLYKIQKKIGCDHELARRLWETGNHDARILATMVVDTDRIGSRELDAWVGAADNHVLNDAVSSVAARSPHGIRKADAWRKVKAEWKSAAGWNIVGYLAMPAGAPDPWLSACLDEIEQKIAGAPNRTRHSMNNALIAIGGYREKLRAKATKAARAIGKVDVDHGKTSCKTPDALPYIKKMATRQSAKRTAKKR